MPMTPWHVGPGFAFKALGGRHVSFTAFVLAQAAMDVPVVYRILNQIPKPHAYSTTILGALVLAGVAVALTMPVAWVVQRLVGRHAPNPLIPWSAAWAGALLGTCSHLALDAVMHSDAYPFWPVSQWNPLYQWVNASVLHELCFWSGGLGVVAWLIRLGVCLYLKHRSPAATL